MRIPEQSLSRLDEIIWGPWLIILLLGTGGYLMIRLRFLPVRNLIKALGTVFCAESRNRKGEKEVTAFSALTTELAATIGTGNIVGVATAMVLGGPGALFWMLLSGVIGLSTKLVESTLCVRYRIVDHKGAPTGGPMYVLRDVFPCPRVGKILAYLFALFAVFASIGMGNMTQGNSIAQALQETFHVRPAVSGICLCVAVIMAVFGGIRRIARVTEYLVPCMAVFYLFGTGMVIFTHLQNLPAGILQILYGAFCPESAAGGVMGFSVSAMSGLRCSGKAALRYGISRGVFSNEAGLGAAGISAACAETQDPVRQGYISMTGVFIDTIVICTLTGLAIAASGVLGQTDAYGELLNGTALMLAVFSSTFGRTGEGLLTVSIVLFAFATIIAWEYQGEKAFEFLNGGCGRTMWYRLMYTAAVFLGTVCSLEAVWDFSDICNGLMAIPNLIMVLVLAPNICPVIRKYDF